MVLGRVLSPWSNPLGIEPAPPQQKLPLAQRPPGDQKMSYKAMCRLGCPRTSGIFMQWNILPT